MEEHLDDIIDRFVKNERVETLRQLAIEKNFEFVKRGTFADLDYKIQGFEIFKGKKGKRIKGMLRFQESSISARVQIYDYWYFGEFKKKKTTIFEIKGEDFNFGKIAIHPIGTFQQLKNIFVDHNKPFPGHKEFHSRYEIFSEEENMVENKINEDLLNLFLERKNLSLEAEGNYVLIYFKNKLLPVNEIMNECDYAMDLVEALLSDTPNDFV